MAINKGRSWITDREEIGDYFVDNFTELFSSSFPSIPENLKGLGSSCITDEENADLMRIPSIEEVKDSIWSLHPLKSLGPDGFLGIFYRTYWKIIHVKVTKFV